MKQKSNSTNKNRASKILGLLLSCLVFCMAFSFLPGTRPRTFAESVAAREINYSIFMHSPTFAFEYGAESKKLYFVDDFDMQLKVYSESADLFEQQSLSLNSFKAIHDATVSGDYLFLLGEANGEYDYSADTDGRLNPSETEGLTPSAYMIEIIDLKQFKVLATLFSQDLKEGYNKLSVCLCSESDAKLNLFMAVTPVVSAESPISDNRPVLLFSAEDIASVAKPEKNDVLNFTTCKVTFSDSFSNENINTSLFKVLLLAQESDIRLVYLFGSTIGSAQVTKDNLKETKYTIQNPYYHLTSLETETEGVNFVAASLMNFDDKSFVFVSYASQGAEETLGYSYLYTLQLGTGDGNTKVEKLNEKFSSPADFHILCRDKFVYFPSEDSSGDRCIARLQFKSQDGGTYTTEPVQPFTNPNIEIEWYEPDDFDYLVTTKVGGSELRSKPWSASVIADVSQGAELAVVGTAKIVGTVDSVDIQDFYFCLFTHQGKNDFGYIPLSDVELKPSVPLASSKLKMFKVVPNTKLYSYPSLVTGTVFNNNDQDSKYTNRVIMTIDANMPVEPLNLIKNYSSDGVQMLKVIVNGDETQTGYIEYQKIIAPNDKNNFVITNSTIKGDTVVYLTQSGDTILNNIMLKKGDRVRLDGARTSNNGRIKVTFNNEYGVEFTGYINSSSVETDSWTFLQILGLILIAINIGLLILILIFKHKKIGYVGTKYNSAKKPINEPHNTLPE